MRFTRQQREAIVYSVMEGAPQHNLSLRQKLVRTPSALYRLTHNHVILIRLVSDCCNGGYTFSL